MPRTDRSTGPAGFARACSRVVSWLPFGLARVVPPSLVGFALINGSTFLVDLLLLSALHGRLGWPVPLAVTVSYAGASALAFALNRTLNFESRAPVGPQTARYVAVLAVNYGVLLLGMTSGLSALGLDYQLARILAGACEGVWIYCAMRWIVFRR